mmetsp:Transcript_39191/g.47453  ORF Transcript_39191/g.47453 Transcript_39191/m.47453 type:complete len:263 (-) Transcript_39191:244-1032(-)
MHIPVSRSPSDPELAAQNSSPVCAPFTFTAPSGDRLVAMDSPLACSPPGLFIGLPTIPMSACNASLATPNEPLAAFSFASLSSSSSNACAFSGCPSSIMQAARCPKVSSPNFSLDASNSAFAATINRGFLLTQPAAACAKAAAMSESDHLPGPITPSSGADGQEATSLHGSKSTISCAQRLRKANCKYSGDTLASLMSDSCDFTRSPARALNAPARTLSFAPPGAPPLYSGTSGRTICSRTHGATSASSAPSISSHNIGARG